MTTRLMSWNEYKNMVSELTKAKRNFYCRGHANEDWKLQTSFHREATRNGVSLIDYLDTIIPEVHYHMTAVRDEIIDLGNDKEFAAFLAMLQHHGFPTPLLDWTVSPYIAAYFAFKDVYDPFPETENVKIYLFDYLDWTSSFQQPLNLRDQEIKYVSVLRPFARFNKRIIPQQATFTVTNVDDMEEHIQSCSTQAKKSFLYTALLPVKEKPSIIRELNLMGINEMALFPSTDGICRAMKSHFFSADTVGPTLKELVELENKTKLTQPGPRKRRTKKIS